MKILKINRVYVPSYASTSMKESSLKIVYSDDEYKELLLKLQKESIKYNITELSNYSKISELEDLNFKDLIAIIDYELKKYEDAKREICEIKSHQNPYEEGIHISEEISPRDFIKVIKGFKLMGKNSSIKFYDIDFKIRK